MPTLSRDVCEIRSLTREAGILLIGESPAFLALLRSVERVARLGNPLEQGSATVLIRGETGTGKELVARAIHYLGERRDYPFVPVNCGAVPESLAENELFGHRPGAFTGASSEAVGLVRLAHKGTLFLDEVDSLPPRVQVALLRFLQDGRFRPLGAVREEQSNVRIIAATNSCLEDDVRDGRMRQDLYYRLNRLSLEVPPLRVRCGDVHVLSQHFLLECAQRYGMPRKALHVGTSSWFDDYAWPGNIRELENLLHREYLLAESDQICIQAPAGAARATAPCAQPASEVLHENYRAAKERALERFDRAYLEQLLERAQGNVTRAAKLAGKERRALGKLLKRYNISHPSHS